MDQPTGQGQLAHVRLVVTSMKAPTGPPLVETARADVTLTVDAGAEDAVVAAQQGGGQPGSGAVLRLQGEALAAAERKKAQPGNPKTATVTSARAAPPLPPDVTSSPPTDQVNQALLTRQPYCAGPEHPRRHSGIGWARFKPYDPREYPKLDAPHLRRHRQEPIM